MKDLIEYLRQTIREADEEMNEIRASEIALTERIAEARAILCLMEQKWKEEGK